MTPSRRAGQLVALLAATLAVLVALTGCGSTAGVAAQPTSPPAGPPDLAGPAVAGIAPPTRVDVPAIGARSTLVETDLNPDGTVEVPPVEQPEQASWYRQSPRPGQRGPAIVLGHVNGDGRPGVFDRLDELTAGDRVEIDRADGTTATFDVYRVDVVDKGAFPTAAVYGNTDRPELRLISCGGDYVGGPLGYSDNVIAYARKAVG